MNLTSNPEQTDQHFLGTNCYNRQSQLVSFINGMDESTCSSLVHSSCEFKDTGLLIFEDNVTNANSSKKCKVNF